MSLKNIKKNKQGVTMMETVVALGVLILGIITILALMASAIAFSQISEHSIIVANLAREGIEVVRSIRDFSRTDPSVLPSGATSFFDSSVDGCYIVDVKNNFNLHNFIDDQYWQQIGACSGCQLYQDQTSNLYSHSATGKETVFKRAIKIEEVSSYEKRVLSKVTWTERGRTHEFVLEDHLTDW